MLKTFLLIDIWFIKQAIKKWLKIKICSFVRRIWNEKKKGEKNWPSGAGTWTPDFLIFTEGKGDEIKSRQPSKIFSTLKNDDCSLKIQKRTAPNHQTI